MKKRIISSLLSILLLFACFAPAVLAVEADAEPTYTVDKFHTDITELKAAVGEAGGVYFGDQDINRITNNIKSGLDANSAVAESVKDEEDYAYYNNIYTQYRARAAVYSTEYLPAFNEAKSALGTNNANVATKEYYDAYNKAKTVFDKFHPSEQAFINGFEGGRVSFTSLAVPTYKPTTGKPEIDAINNSTTYTELNNAVTAAEKKSQAEPNYFTSSEKNFIGRSRILANLINASKNVTAITANGTIPSTITGIHSTYSTLSADEKALLGRISDSYVTEIETAYQIASDYFALGSTASENAKILDIYDRMMAFSKYTTYFDSGLINAITSARTTYNTKSAVKVTYSYTSGRLDVTISINSNTKLNNATINISPSNTNLQLAMVNWVTYNSQTSYTFTLLGGTATVTQLSGNTTISISNITSNTGTITLSYTVPSGLIGKSVSFTVAGELNPGNTETSQSFYSNDTAYLCTHKSGTTTTLVRRTIKEATCSSEGIYAYFCTTCGCRLTTADGAPANMGMIPTKDHTPGEKVTAGVNNIAATCTTPGVQYFECKDCHAVIRTPVTIPASHKINVNTIYWNASANAWYAKCSTCNADVNFSITKSNCTCSTKYDTNTAKKIYSKAATCGENGYSVYECSVCGVSWIETEAASSGSHTWGSWVITKAATCTESGVQTRTCSKCGKTETQTISATGHSANPGNLTVITPSTCTTHGTAQSTCIYCNQTLTLELPFAEHSFDEGKITLQPTCTSQGIKTFTCSVCQTTKTENIAIDPNAHSYGEYITVKEATCTASGIRKHICSHCAHEEEEIIPTSGHTWGEPTTKGKVTTKTCLVCKSVFSKTTKSKTTILDITVDNKFTLNITDSVLANKDVGFNVKRDTAFEQENSEYIDYLNKAFDNPDKKYDCTVFGAYKTEITLGEESLAPNKDTNLVIDLGKDYAKKEILVKYISDNSVINVPVERDGSSVKISGEDFSKFADGTFIVMTSNKKAGSTSIVVPIIICVVIVAIAGIAVVLVLKQKNNRDDMV